jgi:hypothetical protein
MHHCDYCAYDEDGNPEVCIPPREEPGCVGCMDRGCCACGGCDHDGPCPEPEPLAMPVVMADLGPFLTEPPF